jgi:hypothetical protein
MLCYFYLPTSAFQWMRSKQSYPILMLCSGAYREMLRKNNKNKWEETVGGQRIDHLTCNFFTATDITLQLSETESLNSSLPVSLSKCLHISCAPWPRNGNSCWAEVRLLLFHLTNLDILSYSCCDILPSSGKTETRIPKRIVLVSSSSSSSSSFYLTTLFQHLRLYSVDF